ncbi:MAG: carboxypeptidase regulatory-like domain-containing protein [Pyrinomonadaceae bacterium]|nr:carboxypeptidase regulatory-like domain-containing protein [Pyrinomonadaceae bacterium]
MTLIKSVTLIVVFLNVLTAPITGQSAPPPPPPVPQKYNPPPKVPGATVRGKLVYADTGAPVRYALIGFTNIDGNRTSGEFVRTDEHGNFVYENLKAGAYYPVVKNRGILNPEAFNSRAITKKDRLTKLESTFPRVEVESGGQYQIMVRARRGATITGAIRYFDGEPAVGLKVEALPAIGEENSLLSSVMANGLYTAETDDRGVFRFSGIAAGPYLVRATEPVSHKNKKVYSYSSGMDFLAFGENPFRTYFPSVGDLKSAEQVEAYYGGTTEGVNITLPERTLYDVAGIVVRKDTGEPLRNFEVSFVPIKDDEEKDGSNRSTRALATMIRATSNTWNYGDSLPAEWTITNLPAGKYRLTATQKPQYRSSSKTDAPMPEQARYPSVSQDIEITDGDLSGIRFEVPVGGGLSGKIVREDGGDLTDFLMLTAKNEETGDIVRPNYLSGNNQRSKDKRSAPFDFGRLQEGDYRIELMSAGFFVKEIRVGNSIAENKVISLENGEDLKNVTVVVSTDMGRINGTVVGHGQGEEAFIVALEASEDASSVFLFGGGKTARVKDDGSFSMSLPPGEYALVVVSRSSAPQNPRDIPAWIEEQREGAVRVEVISKQEKSVQLTQR